VLNLAVEGDTCLGLFGILDQNASVVNLGIRDANITGEEVLGMLGGKNDGWVAACRADGVVSGTGGAGGLIGSNFGSISGSYAVGEVAAIVSDGVGGLAGSNRGRGSISRCYAAAHVTSTVTMNGYVNVTGGLVGDNGGNIYAVEPPGEVHDSCFLADAEGGGPDNGFGTPLTNAQMHLKESFAGWDFDGVWQICEGRDYPRLRWERAQCGP
jgi:hypothetical protein